MRVTFDPSKRERTLEDRGLDFEDAKAVFEGITVEIEDTRKEYGERRFLCYGHLSGRLVGDRLHPARLCPPRVQHEESQ